MINLLVISNRQIDNAVYFKDQYALEYYLRHSGAKPTTLLFVFWSEKVPNWMLMNYECYGCHTGFLLDGLGKGGSPIDNLKMLRIEMAALNVFYMTEEMDGGKVRLAIPLSLEGTKEDVVTRVDYYIPDILLFLNQDITNVPEKFKRIK